jgi:hypothetical protein
MNAVSIFAIVVTIILAGMLAASSSGFYQPGSFSGPEPTNEQAAACLSDALRLCDIKVVDRTEIKACLMRHRNQLSPECRSAFR